MDMLKCPFHYSLVTS